MTATTLMIQGTTSDAGKSALVTGLCRVLARRGVRVAPFKPQNMALNSAVTINGGEIGRAQAVQAMAAGIEPSTDMNPVLLKPTTDRDAQVIVNGHAVADLDARGYHEYKRVVREAVLAAHARLAADYDVILVEGAGSPAEINLRDNDIANMGFAEAVDCPVLLVGDIDRGGVFAQFVGTLELLSESERARTRGFIVNRFRGDESLLAPGLDMLTERTGKPTLGVLPYLEGLHLDAEDGLSRAPAPAAEGEPDSLRVIVPAIPRIGNHTDFDPLRLHPRVDFRYIGPGDPIPPADLIVLPGSKNTRDDLEWLRERGWTEALERHMRRGGRVMGICGGLQMLGRAVHDPEGVEGEPGSTAGFSLLDIETTLEPHKQLRLVRGRLAFADAPVSGFEMHAGVSHGPAFANAIAVLETGLDGARSDDGQVIASYIHGIFDEAPARDALLRWAGLTDPGGAPDQATLREAGIDQLADACEAAIDLGALAEIIGDPARARHRFARAVGRAGMNVDADWPGPLSGTATDPMMLLAGVRLERGTDWNALAFDAERPTLSSAPVGGGDMRAMRIVNLCVSGPDARAHCDHPDETFARLAAMHDWQGPIVGLMTGVAAARLGIAAADAESAWAVIATAGVSNAHRAGAPLGNAVDGTHRPGTINIIAVSSQGLTAAARAEAIALTAEAKTALLADLGITTAESGRIATGTGTDAIAIACADGDDTPYTGYHTRSGQQLVAAVRDAIQRSLRL